MNNHSGINRSAGVFKLAVVFAFVMTMVVSMVVSVRTAVAATSYTAWAVEEERFAMAHLDGDSILDKVEALPEQGVIQLHITFGDGRESLIPIGSGEAIALCKLGSGDVTGSGVNELIGMIYDPVHAVYSLIVIGSPAGEFSPLKTPDSSADGAYKFKAAFARGYVLELSNQTYDFVLSVPVDAADTKAAYRDDGTAPTDELRATVTGFTDYVTTMYNDRLAIELRQSVLSSAQEEPLGYIVSTIIWVNDSPKLVGQRYATK